MHSKIISMVIWLIIEFDYNTNNHNNISELYSDIMRVAVIINIVGCVSVSCSVVSNSATPLTVACQAPPSMGFFQARILEWVASSFSKGSSQPRDQTQVSNTAGRLFTVWATFLSTQLKLQSVPQLSSPIAFSALFSPQHFSLANVLFSLTG